MWRLMTIRLTSAFKLGTFIMPRAPSLLILGLSRGYGSHSFLMLNVVKVADFFPFLGSVVWLLINLLCRYILYVKRYFQPVLTKEAERVLSSYYQLQRRSALQNAGIKLFELVFQVLSE